MTTRLRLRREDGKVFLNRWGWESKRIGGIFLHRMSAPDPGTDLHDHPWTFVSFVIAGGYSEERAQNREAPAWAALAEAWESSKHGVEEERRPGSFRVMRLDECHRITELHKRHSWSIVIHGPARRRWGFYLPYGGPTGIFTWVDHSEYDSLNRRTLYTEKHSGGHINGGIER